MTYTRDCWTRKVRSTSLGIALCLLLPALPAAAADDVGPVLELEPIIVTAEKRDAAIRKLPLSVNSLSGDSLQDQGAGSISELQRLVPNFHIGSGVSDAKITMRGIRNSSELVTIGADGSVAMHLDGVYLARSQSTRLPLFDIERVEILRGPQSTLYGRNSLGGAINVITRKPAPDKHGYLRLGLGDYDEFRAEGALNAPVNNDVLSRWSFYGNSRDGYGENILNGDDYEDDNTWALRGQLMFIAAENIDLLLSMHYSRMDNASALYSKGTATGGPAVAQFPPFFGSVATGEREVNQNTTGFDDREFYGSTLTLSSYLDELTVRNILSFQGMDVHNLVDVDDTEVSQMDFEDEQQAKQYSYELQLVSENNPDLEWIFGVNLFHEEMDEQALVTLYPFPGFPFPISADAEIEAQAYAAFLQINKRLSDRWRASAGLRYNHDRKTFTETSTALGPFVNDLDEDWDSVPAKANISYDLDDGSLLYASIASGFKSGSFNINQGPTARSYDPEDIVTYETGAKLALMDNKARLNLAYFYSDYRDIQLAMIDFATVRVINASDASIHGIEAEFVAVPVDNLQVNVNGGWLDATFDDLMQLDLARPDLGVQDLSGNSLPQSPEFSVNVGVQYTVDLEEGKGQCLGRVDYDWQDMMYFDQFNTANLSEDSVGRVNASITYLTADGDWAVRAYGENLTDEEVVDNGVISSALAGFPVREFFAPPRTYGVTVSHYF